MVNALKKGDKKHPVARYTLGAFLLLFILLIAFSIYMATYVFSDKPRNEWGALQVQRYHEGKRVLFEDYLRRQSPQDKTALNTFAQKSFREGILDSNVTDNHVQLDLLTTNMFTLSAAGGLTNKNFYFIMCTRLSGDFAPNTTVQAIDIPCARRDNAKIGNGEIPIRLTDKPSWLFNPLARVAGYRDTQYENEVIYR